ncbi:unnamed protein product, partial [Ectocarpus sp. 6 AP-2014]
MMCRRLTHVKCKWAPWGFTHIPPAVLCCGFRVSHTFYSFPKRPMGLPWVTHGSPMGRHGHPARP